MSEDRIDSIIDRVAVQAEIDATKKEVTDLVALIKSVKGTAIGISGAKNASEYANLRRELDLQIKSSEAAAKAAINEARARTANAKAVSAEARATTDSTKAKISEEKATQQTTKAKQLEEKVTRELSKAKETLNKEAIKEAEKIGKLNNEYEQLKQRYLIAANTAKQLAAAKGLDNAETQEAIAVAARYSQQLYNIERAVGQSQRNVGNYTQATFALTQVLREAPAFANSFATGISAISNNIPMLIDQIKVLIAQNVALRAAGLKTIPVFTIFAKSLLSINAILPIGFLLLQLFASNLLGAGKAAKQFSSDLNEIKTNAENAKKSIDDLNKKLDFLQKIGDITVDINTGDEFERSLSRASRASIRTDEEIGKIENSLKRLDTLTENAYAKFQEKTSRKTQDALRDFFPADIPDELINDLKKSDQKYVKTLKEVYETRRDLQNQLEEAQDRQSVARANIRLVRQEEQRKKEKEAADKAQKDREDAEKKRLELIERNRRAEFETQRIAIQQVIDFNKDTADSDTAGFIERELAIHAFTRAKRDLINTSADFEMRTAGLTSKELLRIEHERQDGLLRARRDEVAAIAKLEAEKKEIRDRLKEQEADLRSELQKIAEKGFEDFMKLEAAKQKIRQEAADKIIDLEKKTADETRKLYKRLYDEIAETIFAFVTSSNDKRIAQLRDEIDLLEEQKARDIEIVNQTVTNREQAAAQITIIQARAAAEKTALEKKQRDEEKKKANIERLSTLAEIIGNTAQGVIALTVKAAEAKAQAALLLTNPITAPFAPFALAAAASIGAQIPLVIGAGAAQAAKLLIPAYREGTPAEGHGGGLAIVGDGGKAEGVRLPDGTLLKTPAKSTLVDLPEGAHVFPDFNKMLFNASMTGIPVFGKSKTTDGADSAGVIKELKEVKKAIKKIPQPKIQVQNLLRQHIRYGTSINEHLTRNLGQ